MSRQSGFTLFEILAAMAIFLFGIVGILSLLTASAVMSKEAADLSTASLIADELIAGVKSEVEAGMPRDPKSGRILPQPERPVSGHDGYFYDVRFSEDPLLEDMPVRAEVRVFWKASGKKHSTSFVSFIVPRPQFSREAESSLKQLPKPH
ncbi:MAG: prepilin-type N-terminal cleavage/methylation domain-containing protein [Planctomycetota bacterium]